MNTMGISTDPALLDVELPRTLIESPSVSTFLPEEEASICPLLSSNTNGTTTPMTFSHPLTPCIDNDNDSNISTNLCNDDAKVETSSSSGSSSGIGMSVPDATSTALFNKNSYKHLQKNCSSGQDSNGHGPNGNLQLSKDTPSFVSWNWPLIRKCTFFVFMSSLLAMCAVVVAMIVTLPKTCNPKTAWYRGSVFYEIFPASFQDSDNDGIGDLHGIVNRVDYLKSLGVSAIHSKKKFIPKEVDSTPDRKVKVTTTANLWSPKMALDFFAGCVGGCAGVLVGHPLDTVKVHLQTQDIKNPKYRGTWHCMTSIVRQDKFSGLYRGITSPMGGIAFVNAIVFGVYGNVQRTSKNPDSLSSHALAGGVAGLFQSIVCAPMELAKTRLQLQHENSKGPKFKGPLDCLRHIIKHEGFRGSMRGLAFTAARDVPAFATYFVSYEYMMRQPGKNNVLYGLCAGGLAGMVSWIACYPTDVIKTCIQADDASNPKYKGYMDCIRQGYKSNGLKFFFRGLNSTMIRSFPTNAACFFVVSWIMQWANKGGGVDVVVQTGDPMALVSLATSAPLCHVVHLDRANEKLKKQRSIMTQSLRSFGAFNEAVCQTEAAELAHEFYPDNNKYYVFEDERILSEKVVINDSLSNC